MIEYPQIDKYSDIRSPIHSWDPRAKVVGILCLIFAVVVVPDARMALVGLLVTMLLVLISRLPLGFVAKRLLLVSPFALSFCLLILFTHEGGDEIARFSFLSITSDGLERAALIAVRVMAAITLTLCMLSTMKFETTMKALEHLKIPTKLIQLLMFTYRYIFVLVDEFSSMSRSLTSRGFNKGTNMHTMTTLAKMIGMLLIRSYERADRVYHAMASRGYDGRMETIAEFRMHKTDIVKAITLIATGLALNLCCLVGI
ncbi:MAG: cobalt ECF transporter T component CbiQ [Dehalococcoidia bacterium]|nr:Energy-coupling factor transporter transmembrane protein EcfT [Chloroflexota bacterium]MBT9159127.1 Energy-coupling factor transporter transmembrane protein EcfT [Chloroflexota bacterium]